MKSQRVLISIQNPNLAEKLSSIIRLSEILSFTTHVSSLNETIRMIASNDLVIVDVDDMEGDHEKARLVKAISNNCEVTNFILLSSKDLGPSFEKVYEGLSYNPVLKKPVSIVEAGAKLTDIFSEEKKDVSIQGPQYMSIRLDLLKKVHILPCDIFLSLSSSKFVKYANQGDELDLKRLEGIQAKGIKEVYITNGDFCKYSDAFFSEVLVNRNIFDTAEEYAIASHEVLHSTIMDMGISKHTVKLAETTLNDVIAEYASAGFLAKLLERFDTENNNFLYDHSYLTMVFALEIFTHMDWENEGNRKKLCMAAMFHDLYFDASELAYKEHMGLLNHKKLNKEERDIVLNHPTKMADLLSGQNSVPDDVVKMVANHHEGVNGEAYPKKLPATKLSQLDCVFILAHALAVNLYKVGFNVRKSGQVLESITSVYTAQSFRKGVEAIKAFEMFKEVSKAS